MCHPERSKRHGALLARSLHRVSVREEKAFVEVPYLYGCAGYNESLPCVKGGGSRQGFPETNEMSFGGSLRSETEGL